MPKPRDSATLRRRFIPLKKLDRERVQDLDRGTPVIVYCYDSQ